MDWREPHKLHQIGDSTTRIIHASIAHPTTTNSTYNLPKAAIAQAITTLGLNATVSLEITKVQKHDTTFIIHYSVTLRPGRCADPLAAGRSISPPSRCTLATRQ